MLEGSDQEDPESESPVSGHGRVRSPNVSFNMHKQIARMRESVPSDEEGDMMSPIGSPRSTAIAGLGGREKFLELKRKLQEDQLNRPKLVTTGSNFENPEEYQWEIIDAENFPLMEMEETGRDQSYASISLNEANLKFVEMHDQIKERDIKLLNLESRLNEMDRQIIDLQDTVRQKDKMISSKNEAIVVIQEKFRREASEKEEELSKTQKTLFDMEKILSSIPTTAPLEALIVEKDKELKALNEKSNKAEDKLKKVMLKLKQKSNQLSESQQNVEKWQTECIEKAAQLNQKESILQSLEENIYSLEEEKKKIQEEFSNLKEEMDQSAQINQIESDSALFEARNENSQLKAKLEELELDHGSCKELKKRLDDKSKLLEEAEENLFQNSEQLATLEASLKELNFIHDKKCAELNELIENQNQETEKWQTECREKDILIQNLHENIYSLEEEKNKRTQEELFGMDQSSQINQIESALVEARNENLQLREQLNEFEMRTNDLVNQLETRNSEFELLSQQLSQNEPEPSPSQINFFQDQDQGQGQSANASADADSSLKQKEEELKALSEKSIKMEEKLKKTMMMLKQKNNQLAEAQTQNQQDVEKWQTECMEKKTQLTQKDSIIQNLEEKIYFLEEEKQRIQVQEEFLASDQSEQIKRIESALLSATNENSQLKAHLEELEQNFQELNDQLAKSQENEEQWQMRETDLMKQLLTRDSELSHLSQQLQQLQQNQQTQSADNQGQSSNSSFEPILAEKDEELKVLNEKFVKVEEKLKKAMIMLKQKNNQLAELRKVSTSSALSASFNEEPSSLSPIPTTQSQNLLQDVEKWQTECMEKETQLNQKDSIIQSLQQNILSLEEEKVKIQEELNAAQINSIEFALFEARNENSQLKAQLEELEQNHEQIKDQLIKFREDEADSLNEWQMKTTDLVHQLTTRDSELSHLSEQFQEERRTCNEMKKRLDDKTRLLEEVEENLFQNSEQLATLESSLKELNLIHEKKCAELKELVENQNQESDKWQTECRAQLSQKDFMIQSLQQNIYCLEEEKNKIQQELLSQKEEMDQSTQINQMEFTLLEARNENSQLKVELEELKQNHDQLVKFREDETHALNEWQMRGTELLNQLTTRESELSQLSQQFQQERVTCIEMRKGLDDKSRLLDQAELNLFQNSEKLATLERSLEELNHLVENQNQESEKLKTECREKQSVVQHLQENIYLLAEEKKKMQEEFLILKEEMSQSTQINQIESALFEARNENSQLKAKLEELELELGSCKDIKIQLDNKSRLLEETEVNLFQNSEQLATLEESLKELNFIHDKKCAEMKELTQLIENQNQEVEKCQSECMEKDTLIQNLQENIYFLEEEKKKIQIPTETPAVTGGDQDERNKLTNDLHELKLRNGKLVQRLKQITDKYNGLSKEHEALKSKNEFSLDGAFQDEFLKQIREKDELIAESTKMIAEFKTEKDRLNEKVDILEGANEKILEMNQNQSSYCQQLENQKKLLEQEISGLKWKLEEVENHSSLGQSEMPSYLGQGQPEGQAQTQQQDEAMVAAAQEIAFLQQENFRLNSILQQGQIQGQGQDSFVPPPPTPVLESSQGQGQQEPEIETLRKSLENELSEKIILERKIELLQGKILEIEQSEIKCFEEALMLKSWTRQLEMDNLKYQKEMEQIYNSVSDGDMNNLKVKTLQNEVVRLVQTLHERDKRCEELTIEITRMLEERDGLQLKLSNVLQHNVSMHEEANKGKESPRTEIPTFDKEVLKMKLVELEGLNFAIKLDLRREREARRLVQEQLLFSQSSRVYRDLTSRNKISFSTPTSSPQSKRSSASVSPPSQEYLPSAPPASPSPSISSTPSTTPQQI